MYVLKIACMKLVAIHIHTASSFYSYLWNIWLESCYSNSLPRTICLQTFIYVKAAQAETYVRMYNSSTAFANICNIFLKQHTSTLPVQKCLNIPKLDSELFFSNIAYERSQREKNSSALLCLSPSLLFWNLYSFAQCYLFPSAQTAFVFIIVSVD